MKKLLITLLFTLQAQAGIIALVEPSPIGEAFVLGTLVPAQGITAGVGTLFDNIDSDFFRFYGKAYLAISVVIGVIGLDESPEVVSLETLSEDELWGLGYSNPTDLHEELTTINHLMEQRNLAISLAINTESVESSINSIQEALEKALEIAVSYQAAEFYLDQLGL